MDRYTLALSLMTCAAGLLAALTLDAVPIAWTCATAAALYCERIAQRARPTIHTQPTMREVRQ